MDCMQACEVISAAHDGELVDAGLLAAARAHAEACAECATFVRVLDRIGSTPGPEAPAELVARLGRIAQPDPTPRLDHGRLSWLPRIATFASAAAVLLVAISVGGIALFNRTGQTANEESVKQAGADEALMAAPTAEMAEDAASTRSGAATQPAYVSLDRAVYALIGVTDAVPPTARHAGYVDGAYAGNVGGNGEAYYSDDDPSTLYVSHDDGYRLFKRPVRALGGRTYSLTTATPIGSSGVWPSLPERFGTPVDATGSPVFEPAGYDDQGVEVFVPLGGNAAEGFAISPGTASDDPAAGNPGWTWWEPLP